jgi:transcriptional regulator with XRE-family HTH domain
VTVQPDKHRARVHVTDHDRWHRSHLDEAERTHLAAGVGALLRAARTAAGLTARFLAAEAGASIATVSDLENGRVRPRPQMLADLAEVLDPSRSAGLYDALTLLAGTSLRPDTAAGVRRRRRRTAAVQRRRAGLARLANGKVRAAHNEVHQLVRMPWKSGPLARTNLDALTRAADLFEQAMTRHDRLKADAAAIGDELRRRPRTTPDAVAEVTASFVGRIDPTPLASRVNERWTSAPGQTDASLHSDLASKPR